MLGNSADIGFETAAHISVCIYQYISERVDDTVLDVSLSTGASQDIQSDRIDVIVVFVEQSTLPLSGGSSYQIQYVAVIHTCILLSQADLLSLTHTPERQKCFRISEKNLQLTSIDKSVICDNFYHYTTLRQNNQSISGNFCGFALDNVCS